MSAAEPIWEVKSVKAAQRELDDLPDDQGEAIRIRIDAMSRTRQPSAIQGVKVLIRAEDMLRVRAGDYRAIVAKDPPALILCAAGKREDFYDQRLEVARSRLDGGATA